MLKRILLALLLVAGLLSAGCGLFHRNCSEYDHNRYSECDRR